MSSEELLRQISLAEQALATALARARASDTNATQAEMVELRESVSLATMKLARLRGRWTREFSPKRPQTSDH